jgi:glyoxylase-like metal-dependent hydrolase (beta-lactamase superfamily II)
MSPEIFPFQLGAFRCIAINDGWFSNAPASAFFPNAPTAQLEQALHQHGFPIDTATAPATCMFVDTGQHRVLFDTGGGQNHPPYGKLMPGPRQLDAELGQFLSGLTAVGVDLASIDTVIFSHAHPEHISGNVDRAEHLLFPNAQFVWARGEWMDFRELEVPDQDTDWDGWAGPTRFAQQQCLAIEDRIVLVDPEIEVLPGVRLIPTPGDTPHHICVEFSSGEQRLVCLADAMHNPIEVMYPDWGVGGAQAAQSRREILQRAGATALVHGFHFPFPGLGRLHPDANGWRWLSGL